jgi:hypothetical protein
MEENATQTTQEPQVTMLEETPVVREAKIPADVVLQLENAQLRAQNIQFRLELMQAEANKWVLEKSNILKEMEGLRSSVLEKYNIDVATCRIAKDGTVTPLTPQELQQLAAQRG